MPSFKDLDVELQAKVKMLEAYVHKEGKDAAKHHELYRELKKSTVICGAITGSGKVCLLSPLVKEDGTTNGRCERHGGKSTGPRTEEGKKKAIEKLRGRTPVHGLYSKNFLEMLTEDEIKFMEWLEDDIRRNYEIRNALEETALQMLIMEAVRHFRMVNTRFERESKHVSEFLTKFLRIVEAMGWKRKNEDDKNGVNLNVVAKLVKDFDKYQPQQNPSEKPKLTAIEGGANKK